MSTHGLRAPATGPTRARGAALLAAAAALLLPAASHAQAPANPQHAISGLWVLETKGGVHRRASDLPLTPAALAHVREDQERRAKSGRILAEGHVKCLPDGFPHLMAAPFGVEFLETPGKVTVLAEISNLPRTIYLDRTTHPADADPSWNGDAVGHWEGDTLVVDTVGFNDSPAHLFNAEVIVDRSPKLHVIERIHVDAEGMLVDEMTLDDPEVFTRPYALTYRYRRLPADARLMEYVCEVDPAALAAFQTEAAAAAKAPGR